MGKPILAETKIDEWNEIARPQHKLSLQKVEISDESKADRMVAINSGDSLLDDYNIYRSIMLPREKWNRTITSFANKWEQWKEENNYCDFTDLIERTLEEDRPAPDEPRIGIFDEAQDFSPLQLSLIIQWSKYMDYCMLAGDDDQTLYQWAGASADSLLKLKIDEKRKTILNQSYRVSQAVYKLAMSVIRRIPDSCRQVKEYRPTEATGSIKESRATYRNPEPILSTIDEALKLDKTIMILSSCGYQLRPVIKELRSRGYLFWNPYRKKNGAWNPIRYSKKGTSTLERLQEFLKVNHDDFPWKSTLSLWKWIKDIDARILHHGAKERLKKEATDFKDFEDMSNYLRNWVLNSEGWYSFTRADSLHLWFTKNLLNSRKNGYKYPSNVVRGLTQPLPDRPNIILGTIHSVKGAEADSVVLFPDISLNAQKAADDPEGRYDLYRQFYVGITRAREKLTICSPADRWYLRI
jgi:superfamily I DNA/RNA helicase